MAETLNLSNTMPAKQEGKRSQKQRRVEYTHLAPVPGTNPKRHRVGRGHGSGWGKRAGRGQKGQKSRTGYSHKAGFEGGQNPLYKRVPKRGFTNIFKQEFQIVNLWLLEKCGLTGAITLEQLKEKGLIRRVDTPVKLLGHGEVSKKIELTVHAASKEAVAKVAKAGGEVKLIGSK